MWKSLALITITSPSKEIHLIVNDRRRYSKISSSPKNSLAPYIASLIVLFEVEDEDDNTDEEEVERMF